ncbi:MAG: TIGR04282 family arsenosugar biosynthesis glycosyltransferase [Gammaproteobacteria bacterium]
MIDEECALMVFTKAPVPGKVKTRLIPSIGEAAAADLYKSLILRTLRTACSSNMGSIQLWCHDNLDHPFVLKCCKDFPVELHSQQGSNLGERMYHAIKEALGHAGYALVIGCDCPELSLSDIHTACRKLRGEHDVVLGPCEDGGYYLIGAKSVDEGIFNGIEWGSATVLSDTRQRMQALGMNWCELREHWDLDCPADLFRYQTLVSCSSQLPVIDRFDVSGF